MIAPQLAAQSPRPALAAPKATAPIRVRVELGGVAPSHEAVADVSLQGCSLAVSNDLLRPGSFVTVSLPGGKPLGALVRWSHNHRAGLEFLRGLTPDEPEWLALIA